MFELNLMTKVRVLDVRVLAAKDRKPDDPPGAQLLLQATLPSSMLAMLDGWLETALFRKAAGGAAQGRLDGMEGMELTPIGDHIKRLKWAYEQSGVSIEIDRGLGGKRNIVLQDCKAHRLSLSPREGGSVVVQWTVDAPGLADATWAKLPGLKASEIELTMIGPEVAGDGQADIEDQDTPPSKDPAPTSATTPEEALAKAEQDAQAKADSAKVNHFRRGEAEPNSNTSAPNDEPAPRRRRVVNTGGAAV